VASQTKLTFELGLLEFSPRSSKRCTGVARESVALVVGNERNADRTAIRPSEVCVGERNETMLLNDSGHISDQTSACGDGRYIVFRRVSRAGSAAVNLWRMDSNGSNVRQLTTGQNDREPSCTRDGKWVYYTDQTDRQTLKRVSIEAENRRRW